MLKSFCKKKSKNQLQQNSCAEKLDVKNLVKGSNFPQLTLADNDTKIGRIQEH